MSKRVLAVLISSTFLLAGCQGTKQETGAIIGAGIGALLGNQVGGGSGRKIATATGALLGMYIGQKIGAGLDERDRLALENEALVLLEQERANSSTWKSEENAGVNAKIETSQPKFENKQQKIVKIKQVENVASMKLIGKTYQSNASSRVRLGPSLDHKHSASLGVGETFTAVGVTDDNWIMVAKNNVTIGYVHGNLVKEYSRQETRIAKAEEKNKAINLDDLTLATKNDSSIDLDNIELEQETVIAEVECKSLDIQVENKGKSSTDNFEACRSIDGSWEIS